MQLKEKPELNQINEESEFLAKTYQPNRPIKEPKSVARVDRANLQPIKKPQSVTTVDRTNLQPIKEPQSVAKIDRRNLQPIKQPKSVATVDRTNLQPIKQPKSVATTDRQDLQPIKERKSVATTYQPYLPPIKERESGGGLRMIELFVVVIIIGILAQIALPSFLSCGNKAKLSEAKQYVASMNKGQQAKYAEDGTFSNSIDDMGIGIKTQTTNYNYSIGATKNAVFSYGVARSNNLRSYVGAVFLVPSSAGATTTVSILCEAKSPGKTQPPDPILLNGDFACGDGTVLVTK